MSVVEFKGIGPEYSDTPGTFAHAINRMILKGGDYSAVLKDIGIQSERKTVQKLLDNKVTPKTTRATIDARRGPDKRGITLVDNSIGYKQVSHKEGDNYVEVGVPAGYMSAHQLGKVPNAPRRMFLTMLSRKEILKLVNYHWKKAIR